MLIMNDLEWPMLSYYVIYNEMFKKVIQRREKEALSTMTSNNIDCCTSMLPTETQMGH